MKNGRRSLVFLAASFFCLLLLSLLYTGKFGSHVVPLNQWKKQRTNWGGSHTEDQKNLFFLLEGLVKGKNQTDLEATGFACHSDFHSEVCVSDKPVRIDTLTMKVYAPFIQGTPQANRVILPYLKKEDKWIIKSVTPVQILQGSYPPPPCHYTHDVPAVVFSSAGATANAFHDFSEIIIPLFLTSRLFQSRLQFIITDFRLQYIAKYVKFFSRLSRYDVINPAANVSVHCFPGVVFGLHYHGALTLNATKNPGGYSMRDFKQFLRETYNLKRQDLSQSEKPVLLLISRPDSRMFINEGEMVTMMKALGFAVVVAKPDMMADLDKISEELNSCSVLVGAHGAGLTNALFLPEGAVMVQIVGLGLGRLSTFFFSEPSKAMPLSYVEYKIEAEESSLISHYGKDHPIVIDPESVATEKGYEFARDVYLGEQKLNINVVRFRETLVKALGLLGRPVPMG